MFGDDDNVGMFNLQTPERIARAAQLVKRGAVFALNWDQTKPNPPLFGRGGVRHTVFRQNPAARARHPTRSCSSEGEFEIGI